MFDPLGPYLAKAQECLEGAQSEYANNRRNNCANRCYYACFQAAIHALIQGGVQPRDADGQWSHGFVQAEFGGQMIRRRRMYPSELRDTLSRAFGLRQVADYGRDYVSDTQAARILDRAQRFVEAIETGGERR
jgi:uncharacterized protein (UPF0332 family)